MTENKNEMPSTDWSQLAKDALDIWQNHLTSLATDPKAKEEMARFVTPMTEAMTGWSSVMQQGMHQMMKMAATAAEQAQAYAPPETESEIAPETAPETVGADEDVPLSMEEAVPDVAPSVSSKEFEQQGVREEAVRHDVSVTPAALDEPARDEQPVASESVPHDNDSSERAESAPESGRTLTPDGSRSLAELAGRLAVLERELDHLRPRTRRKDAAAEPVADATDECVAGANQGANPR